MIERFDVQKMAYTQLNDGLMLMLHKVNELIDQVNALSVERDGQHDALRYSIPCGNVEGAD